MIEYLDMPFRDEESYAVLNLYVKEWFKKNFKEITPPQKFGFKLIYNKKNILITAPTGSGKTLSAFLSIISKLFDYSLEGKLENKVYCIYVSPLRALNNDVKRNLTKPLEEIFEMVRKAKGVNIIKENIKNITIGVRTGDTTQKERRNMLVHPPHILVTTPESLAILINSQKFVENLKGVEYLIIDEIHELANNKRGVHLSLSIERLSAMVNIPFTRIGLGATLYPLDEAAKFLVGYNGNEPNDCIVVDASWSKKIDAKVISPIRDMIYAEDEEVEDAMYNEINKIIKQNKTSLIFTNTRSGTERVIFNLKKRFGYGEEIAAHHGSLSRESRFEVEELLKKGTLKCAVSSTSLELGVDIGSIETVIQLGSPKSVTRAIQRIGRAGHSFKETAKGKTIVLNRDDLVECAIMFDSALKKRLDSFTVPQNALDVLAQHIIGMSLTKKWGVDEAYLLIKRSYAYHNLPKGDFLSLLDYLAGKYVGLESRRVYGKIWYDEQENTFVKRGKYTKVIYMLNLGTIPEEVAVNVFKGNKWIGNIEEEFMMKLKPKDIFTLGGRLYKFEYAKGMKCYVSDSNSNSPTIPPWFSEQLPLSYELANDIGAFRLEMLKAIEDFGLKKKIGDISKIKEENIPKNIKEILMKLPIDKNSEINIFQYFLEQYLFAKDIPNKNLLLIELTQSPSKDKYYLIFHSLFGRRVNDALSRAVAIKIGEILQEDVSINISDNGFVVTFEEEPNINQKIIDQIMEELSSSSIISLLKRNIKNTELMRRKFRHVAVRSFMILRNYKGYKMSVNKQQVSSHILLKAIEEMDTNFPILKETYREIMNDLMNLPKAEEVLSKIRKKEIRCKLIRTPIPSPFSHSLLTFGQNDVIMIKDRHKYLQELHKLVMKRIKK
ncbi:MAG: ATP-dependent helicase [Candidatus Marsarchaeota archaeon]|nr:ATP-dependent helicase [Candidatus Marsarchaeota archaeon]